MPLEQDLQAQIRTSQLWTSELSIANEMMIFLEAEFKYYHYADLREYKAQEDSAINLLV